MPCRDSCAAVGRPSLRLVSELVATAATTVFAGFMALVAPPVTMPFFLERDPLHSFPYVRPATVPSSMLVALSICVPAGCMLLCITAAVITHRVAFSAWAKAISYHWLAVAQALLLTVAVTDTIKVATAFPRPNFFAYCNYAGYRDALASGNFSAYNKATAANAIGRISLCQAPEADVHEAQLSFPSGHASISFAGMTLAALFLRHALLVARGAHVTLPALLAASPLILAAWIAITRVRDRFHNTVDVLCGAVIGALGGVIAWQHLVAHGRHALVPTLWGGAVPSVVAAGAKESGGHGAQDWVPGYQAMAGRSGGTAVALVAAADHPSA